MKILILILVSQSAFAQNDVYSESTWKGRDAWQKPDEIIKKLRVDKSSVVADLGCNEGYMTFKLSGVVSKVFAVDVDQSKLDKLERHKPENVILVKGDYDNPKLPENSLDAVLILDTYHEMDDHDDILKHIKAALKAGGRLVICEPIDESRRNSTREQQETRHEVAMKFVLEDLEKAGFKVQEKLDPFVDREKIKGDKMWIIVASK